jgi:phosphate:Na+ symporter
MHAILGVMLGAGLLVGGIHIMRYGLVRVFWQPMQRVLGIVTKTPLRGLLVGVVAAALLQSSTAVSLITIGLVGGNCLSFRQGLSIILGANIGTCVTVQLMSLSLPSPYLMPLLLLTAGLAVVKKVRHVALAISGLLSMFAGLNVLTESMGELTQLGLLSHYIDYAGVVPAYGILVGVIMTFIFQSSSAATASLMIMVGGGMVDLTAAAYIVYGNNIGSCLSSLVVSAAAPLAARRIAISHILLNVLGVMVFYPLTNFLTTAAMWLSTDDASGVAAIHTLFNIISSLAVLPVIGLFARGVEWLTPEK